MKLTSQPLDPDSVTIVVGPAVPPRLEALHLWEEVLREATWTGLLQAFRCTKHDPPSMAGYLSWGKTVRDLRDKLVPLGWEPNDDENYSTVVRPDGQMAIAVAAGDCRTGTTEANPSTRNAKGEMTRRVINRNQLTFADLLATFPVPRSVPGFETWLLLHFVDERAEEVRLELSLPRGMDDSHHVDLWRERIILGSMPLITPPLSRIDDDDDGDDDLDIPVPRRS